MNDHLQTLDTCPLLAGLPPQAKAELAQLAHAQRYTAGEIIYSQGAMQSRLSIIAEGRVRLCSSNANGREATLAILDAGAWFGDTVFSPGTPRVFGATAHDDCLIVDIPGEPFRQLLARYPQAYPVVLDLVSRRLWAVMSIVQDDVLRGTEARIGRRLLFLAQMHNRSIEGDQAVSFQLTRELLANMMGMTRQGLHKILKEFESLGLVEFHYGSVTIPDTDKLQDYVESLD